MNHCTFLIAGYDSHWNENVINEAEVSKSRYRRQRQTARRASDRIMMQPHPRKTPPEQPAALAAPTNQPKKALGKYLFKD